MFLLLSGGILALILYYYAYPFWTAVGLRSEMTDSLMLDVHRSGVFRSQLSVKFVCLFFTTLSVIVRSGSSKQSSWLEILLPLLAGLLLFFGAQLCGNGWLYVFLTLAGYVMYLVGAMMNKPALRKKLGGNITRTSTVSIFL